MLWRQVQKLLPLIEERKLINLPVVDINNHLLGVIRNHTLMDATKQDVTQDVQALFGAGREERALSKVSFAVRKRLPWLQINLATAFLAASVVAIFEDTIARITVLAVFLPVVAGQSGNTGSQALAVTMRGLALREISVSQWFVVARKEILVGAINGVAVAITTALIVLYLGFFIWPGNSNWDFNDPVHGHSRLFRCTYTHGIAVLGSGPGLVIIHYINNCNRHSWFSEFSGFGHSTCFGPGDCIKHEIMRYKGKFIMVALALFIAPRS